MLPAFHHETSRRGEPYSSRPGSPTNWPLLASAKSRPEAQKPARLATWSNSNCVKPSLALDSLTDICVGTSRSNSTDLLPRHEVRPSGCVDASCDGIRPTTEWPRALFVARGRADTAKAFAGCFSERAPKKLLPSWHAYDFRLQKALAVVDDYVWTLCPRSNCDRRPQRKC
jgi:hypothetical protein